MSRPSARGREALRFQTDRRRTDYYDMMTQNGMGMGSGMMGQGMGYGGQGMGMGNMMGMGQGGMPGQMQGGYGMPRSWYGRQQYDPSRM